MSQIELLKNESNDKDEEIFCLKEELDYVKEERNENIFQVKSILKDFEVYNQYGSNQSARLNNFSIGKVKYFYFLIYFYFFIFVFYFYNLFLFYFYSRILKVKASHQ